MTIEQQAAKVRKVKRAESGMIIDPVTLPLTSKVADAKTMKNMELVVFQSLMKTKIKRINQ
jgi:hypothetical protein